jgi:predicted ArsR family transcriptional regulator
MSFENRSDPAAERILLQLKTRGPTGTLALAETLGLTGEAVRQQIVKLLDAGLVEGEAERGGGSAGRPRKVWTLTAAGHARFPDAHAQLTAELIRTARRVFGEAGVDRLIDARREDIRTAYLQALAGARTLGERVRRLAGLREREGYMARAERDGRDWLLIEDHCPICVAAQACQGFCRAELELFREVLGTDAQVVREQHLLAGARRCVYRIGTKKTIETPVLVTS